MFKSIYIILAVIAIFTPAVFGANTPEQSIRWAERLLAQSDFDYQFSQGYGAQRKLRDAEQAFTDILTKYGKQSGRVWAGLARAQAGLGKYDEAVDSYKQALSLLPGHKTLQAELRTVQNQQAAAKSASAYVEAGETVLQALPYQDLWVVFSAKVKQDKYTNPEWPNFTDSRLTVFKGEPNSLKQVWRSGILGYPGYTKGEFNDIYLYIKDVTGDNQPDLVIPKILYGASWTPSHINIFTWRNNKIVHLLGAVSDDTLMMKDLNHDSRYEVITDHAIGWNPAHYEQPRWLYVYAYKNGAYQLAEKDFPSQYRELYQEIRTMLRKYPNDFELLYYLGRAYEIQRKPQLALTAYRQAEKNAVIELANQKEDKDAYGIQRISNTLREIRTRISALQS